MRERDSRLRRGASSPVPARRSALGVPVGAASMTSFYFYLYMYSPLLAETRPLRGRGALSRRSSGGAAVARAEPAGSGLRGRRGRRVRLPSERGLRAQLGSASAAPQRGDAELLPPPELTFSSIVRRLLPCERRLLSRPAAVAHEPRDVRAAADRESRSNGALLRRGCLHRERESR